MRAYQDLFGHRQARWPLLASTLARFTPGMIVLALVLAMREADYAYTAIGVVSAGHQIGVGFASPVQGRLADRYGQVRVLVPDALLYLTGTAGLAAMVVGRWSVGALVVVAVLSGIVFPPVSACSRVLMSRLFPSGQLRETAFALTSIAVEIGYILGPLGAIAIAATVGPGWAVAAAGGAAAVGAGGYALTAAARAMPRRDPAQVRRGALRAPGVRVMVVAFAAIAVAFGVFDIVVPAVAELAGRPNAAGLIAAIAAGSLVGGLVYGARPWPGTVVSRLRVLSVVFALGLVASPLALTIPASTLQMVVFGVALTLGGLCLAPTTICAFQLIDDLAPRGAQTEAQSWMQTAVVSGVAVGAALSGASVDLGGPTAALLAGAACVGLGAAIVNLRSSVLEVVPTVEVVGQPTGTG